MEFCVNLPVDFSGLYWPIKQGQNDTTQLHSGIYNETLGEISVRYERRRELHFTKTRARNGCEFKLAMLEISDLTLLEICASEL